MNPKFQNYMSSYGFSQTYVDGKKVSDLAYDADYNGKIANIAARDGEKKMFMKLNNDDIMKLLNVKKISNKSLHHRIRSLKKSKSKSKTKTKTNSKTKTKTKTKTKSKTKKKY